MDEELKDNIKTIISCALIVGVSVGGTYLSYKIFSTMIGKVVASELLKKGAILAVVA